MAEAAPTPHRVTPAAVGIGLTVASAVFLSGLGVTTRLAYGAGATLGTLLSGRFLVAMVALWPLVWALRSRRPSPRQALSGLLLGVGYSAHAWLYSSSLARLDPGIVDMLLFTYPALVTVGAVLLRRERWSRRRALALGAAAAGTMLVLAGGLHSIDPLGATLAVAASLAYSAYILTSSSQLPQTDPLVLTALVTTGAAATLTALGLAEGDVSVRLDPGALAYVAAAGLVAVAGMATFVAGIGRLGASRASIVSAIQPALTPVLGFLVFSDRLGPSQVLGGGLVIAGVVILEAHGVSRGSRSHLAWLPARELRRVRRNTAVRVHAGLRLIRQGDRALAFFVIERGRATVTRDGQNLAELGPGDFFGEITLLRGGRRTASVVAASDMRLRLIPEHEFGRAMKTLPTLARAVGRVMPQRLPACPAAPAPG
jgi:drug/metabolite transporter (DMT)-like permease